MISTGKRRQFVTLQLYSSDAPAHPGDSILLDGKVIGTITSAAWGHRVEKNLAMGFIDPDHSEIGSKLKLEVLGELVDAGVCEPCLYDAANTLPRS